MFAMDFQFDQNQLSDFNCIIAAFDNSDNDVSGGTLEYDSVKAPSSDIFKFYGSQYNEVLTWNFSIIKNPCSNEDIVFTHSEERKLLKWLKRTDGYKWFKFMDGSDTSEETYYKVKIDVVPHRINGATLGYDLTITSNCAYGFSDLITKDIFFFPTALSYTINLDTDANEYIYPEKVVIKNNTATSFYIENQNDKYRTGSTATHFTNIPKDSTLTLDCENQIITGLNSPDNFNWYFPRLVDGENKFTVTIDDSATTVDIDKIELLITYREARMVMI